MRASIQGERLLTRLDAIRLRELVAEGFLPDIADLLNEADVLHPREIPPDVVTMDAQFVILDLKTKRRRTLVLCHPADAEPSKGHISVLSPVGMALLGQRVGAKASWLTPDGEQHFAEVENILLQPTDLGAPVKSTRTP